MKVDEKDSKLLSLWCVYACPNMCMNVLVCQFFGVCPVLMIQHLFQAEFQCYGPI